MFHEEGAQYGELGEVFGTAVGVDAGIEEEAQFPVLPGHVGADGGSMDAGKRLDAEERAHEHGSRIARTDDGIHPACRKQSEAHSDGGRPFLLERLGGMLMHVDPLGGMHEAHGIGVETVFPQHGAQHRLVPEQD